MLETTPPSVPQSSSAGQPADAAAPAAANSVEQVRRLVTEIPGPKSRELAARRSAAVASGVGSTMPVYAARAAGGIVVDVDGNSLIDLGSGIAVTTVGNAAPEVVAQVQRQVAEFTHTCFTVTPYEGYVAVCEQLNRLTPGDHPKRSALFNSGAEAVAAVRRQVAEFTHTCFTVTPYEGYVAVCEQLNRLTPGDHPKRSALFNSGAEAVENAVKIARHATGREAVIVFDHAYHGRTNLTMAMTSKNMPYKDGFGPFAGEVYRAPMSYPFRDPGGLDGAGAAARAISMIESQVGAKNVACVVIEPIQGEGGFVVPAMGFLPALAGWCQANGVLFVADEIQSGFARTGTFFAVEPEGVVPDLVTTAKGIAGGLPLSGVTGRAELMDSVHSGGLGGTYTGNPVACAAALGAIEAIETHGLVERARMIGERTLPRLGELAAAHPQIGDVRGRGAMLALEFVRPGTIDPDAAEAGRVSAACHRAGVITLTCGTYGNVLRLLPPLVIPDDLLDDALGVLAAAVAAGGH